MRLLATGFALAEGPTLLDDGSLLVSSALGGGLRRLDPAGETREVLVPDRKGIGGVALDAEGRAIVSGREVARVADDGLEVLIGRADGVAGYNDLAATPEGGLLAGALHFSPFAGEPPVPGSLRYLSPTGEVRVWHEGVVWPNGIGFSPDGAIVYVSDFSDGTVWSGPWGPDQEGRLDRLLTTPSGDADGLAVAADGSLFVALGSGGGLGWFDAGGGFREVIDVPAGFVSSVCFAGAGLSELVVTTLDNTVRPDEGGAVFVAPAPTAGVRLPRYRRT